MKTAVTFLIFLFTLSWVAESTLPILERAYVMVDEKSNSNKEEKDSEKNVEKQIIDPFTFHYLCSETSLSIHLFSDKILYAATEVSSPPPDNKI